MINCRHITRAIESSKYRSWATIGFMKNSQIERRKKKHISNNYSLEMRVAESKDFS